MGIMAKPFPLDGKSLSLDAVRRLTAAPRPELGIPGPARRRVERAARFVRDVLKSGRTVYGITTGFGRLANVRIDRADLAQLQEHLIVSHAAGVGDPLPLEEARMAIAVRAATLASGHDHPWWYNARRN